VRILIDYRPALSERTGVGEYVHELTLALVASAPSGESLTVFSSSWKDRLAAGTMPGAAVVDRRVPVRVLNAAWHRLGWPPVEALARASYDVVQATSPLLVPSSRAARVVTIYDLDFLDHPERTRREIRRDYPSLAPAHARAADRVIVISEHTAADVERRLGVPRGRITVARPGAPAWPRREREPDDGVILFLGTLEPRKNLGVLLDAYERLLDREPSAPALVLAGRIPPEAAPLVARVGRPPLAGRVRLPGYVAADARLDLYRSALVFVLPSHTEGFGMPAVEAMTVGVPVIAADRGALPEAVGAGGVLVNGDDPDALAAALAQVLTDAGRRQRLRDAAWDLVRRFRWSDTAACVREAWTLAIERHRGRRG